MMRPFVCLFLLGLLISSCYMDWEEIDYVEPCDPLVPGKQCAPNERCTPKPYGAGDPVCTRLGSNQVKQNRFCLTDEGCYITETCQFIDNRVNARICMKMCKESADCDAPYSCRKGFNLFVRGEEYGGCVAMAPLEWSCDIALYAELTTGTSSQCDCGCGVFDPDCEDESSEHCDACHNESPHLCVREGWTCDINQYDIDDDCDCGCGIPDPDCEDETVASCQNCPRGSCGEGNCGSGFSPIQPNDNSQCVQD